MNTQEIKRKKELERHLKNAFKSQWKSLSDDEKFFAVNKFYEKSWLAKTTTHDALKNIANKGFNFGMLYLSIVTAFAGGLVVNIVDNYLKQFGLQYIIFAVVLFLSLLFFLSKAFEEIINDEYKSVDYLDYLLGDYNNKNLSSVDKGMKTIVITGASRGIGLTTAKKFLAEGWHVVGTYNKTLIPINNPNLFTVNLDQGDEESILKASIEIKKIAPSIDVLLNNAGITLDWVDPRIDLEKIRKTFDVNVFGLIDLTEKLLPDMSVESHIINVDSNYGSFSLPIDDDSSTGYRLSKAALNMYTRTLAFRLKEKRIIVSSLDPGWVKTDMGNLRTTDEDKPNREPEQVADDVYKLVSTVKESGCFWRFGEKREW